MEAMNLAQQTVVAILGGGGAVAIFTLAKAYIAVRGAADTREAAAIANLEKWRKDADDRAARAYYELGNEREVSAYWQRRCGAAEHQLARHGIDPPEPPPAPTEWRRAPTRGEPT